MRSRTIPSFLPLVIAAIGWSGAASASVIVPPRDLGELARRSDAVVLATVVDSTPKIHGTTPHRTYTLCAARIVSGADTLGATFTVSVPGGVLPDGHRLVVTGMPRLVTSKTYLLFLDRPHRGTWRPALLSWGVLRSEQGSAGGSPVLVPIDAADLARLVQLLGTIRSSR